MWIVEDHIFHSLKIKPLKCSIIESKRVDRAFTAYVQGEKIGSYNTLEYAKFMVEEELLKIAQDIQERVQEVRKPDRPPQLLPQQIPQVFNAVSEEESGDRDYAIGKDNH